MEERTASATQAGGVTGVKTVSMSAALKSVTITTSAMLKNG